MDFLEIMDICAYDIDDAKEMANRCCSTDVVEEVLNQIGLERLRPVTAPPDEPSCAIKNATDTGVDFSRLCSRDFFSDRC